MFYNITNRNVLYETKQQIIKPSVFYYPENTNNNFFTYTYIK